jgi:DNA repair exonuclease SbcCD ATPase subunit
MAQFPRKIWNGLSSSRESLDIVKSPDHSDWAALLEELQAVQRYILNLTNSIDVMPNVAQDIHSAKKQIDALEKDLSRLTSPKDLQRDLDELKVAVKDADVKNEHDRLKRGVKKLFLRTEALIKAHKKLKNEVKHTLDVLANSVRVNMASLRKDMEERTNKLGEQIKELQDVLEIPELD